MLNAKSDNTAAGEAVPPASDSAAADPAASAQPSARDESIIEEISTLIDDATLYAQAEIAFQKTRASLAGRSIAVALGALVLAVILLHIALIALAVGFVIALAPLVTIWGAIAIVVGGMLLGVAALGSITLTRARRIGAMFGDAASDAPGTPNEAEEPA